MTTNQKTTLILRRIRFCVLLLAGCLCIASTKSALAQAAEPSSSTKKTIISNLEYRISGLESQIDAAKQQAVTIREMRDDLVSQRESLHKTQDTLGVSKESFGDVLKSLQAQRVELMIDLAGIDARRDTLTDMQKNTLGSNADPNTLQILEKLVDLRLKKYDRAKSQLGKGMISPDEVSEAEVQYLGTKIQLNNAKNSIKASPRINEELLDVSLDRAEKQARLAKTNELLAKIVDSRNSFLKDDDISDRIAISKQRSQQLESEILASRREIQELEKELEKVQAENY